VLLKPEEFDQSYFDGATTRMRHNAGYSRYERWHRYDGTNSTGEFWADFAASLLRDFDLAGEKILELGCAKGFVVEDLRAQGVDAYGCDVSEYAISKASESVQPYLLCGEALLILRSTPPEEYDFIISRGLLECIDPVAFPSLVAEMNRTAQKQVHFVHIEINPEFYVRQSLQQWAAFDWKEGTVLIAIDGGEVYKA